MKSGSYDAWRAAECPADTADRNEDVTPAPWATKHATWGNWPHVGTCYHIRTRGGVSAFSREGFAWTDSYAQALPRPSLYIMFHNGPLNGKTLSGDRG